MIKRKIREQKGITLVTLTISVIIMIIISSTLLYNARTGIKTRNLNNMYNDINVLEERVGLYYTKYGKIPVLDREYTNIENIKNINPNDNEKYYAIDLQAIENITLNFGKDYETYKEIFNPTLTDIYVINEQSHNIYYVKGISLDNNIYYTIPGDYTKIEVPTVSQVKLSKMNQNVATLEINVVNKSATIQSIILYVNDSEYKIFEYTGQRQYVDITLPFYEEKVCYIKVINKNGEFIESEKITLKNEDAIETATDLKKLATIVNAGETFENKKIQILNDIDLEGTTTNKWIPIGNTKNPFKGSFEGNEYKIKNIYINTTEAQQGLFGFISNAEIKNITLYSGTINGGEVTGGIVGESENSSIIGCENKVTISGQKMYTGGICGSTWNVRIEKCSNKANITGEHDAGGIAGRISGNSTIKSCYNEGEIKTRTEGSPNGVYLAGGIVAYTDNIEGANTVISDSYNKGNVYSYINAGGIVGGIQGGGTHKIKNCYSIGTLTGEEIYGVYGGYGTYNGTPNLEIGNNYWLNSCGAEYGGYLNDNSNAIPCDETKLKSLATVLEGEYKEDKKLINLGYPILLWQ